MDTPKTALSKVVARLDNMSEGESINSDIPVTHNQCIKLTCTKMDRDSMLANVVYNTTKDIHRKQINVLCQEIIEDRHVAQTVQAFSESLEYAIGEQDEHIHTFYGSVVTSTLNQNEKYVGVRWMTMLRPSNPISFEVAILIPVVLLDIGKFEDRFKSIKVKTKH